MLAKAQKQKKEEEQQTARSGAKGASQAVVGSSSEGAPLGSPAATGSLDLEGLGRASATPSQPQGADASYPSVKGEEAALPKEKSEDVMAKIMMDKDVLAEAEGAEVKQPAP